MLWLVVGLPAVVVAAGIATVVIAVRAGGSDAIPEDVRRMAQVQIAELGADQAAAERGLSLVLSVQEGELALLPASGEYAREAPLRLSLHHPTDAAQDRTLTLAPSADGWRAKAELDGSHDWRVVAADADGRWRLQARLPAGQRGVLLRPALDTAGATPPVR